MIEKEQLRAAYTGLKKEGKIEVSYSEFMGQILATNLRLKIEAERRFFPEEASLERRCICPGCGHRTQTPTKNYSIDFILEERQKAYPTIL